MVTAESQEQKQASSSASKPPAKIIKDSGHVNTAQRGPKTAGSMVASEQHGASTSAS